MFNKFHSSSKACKTLHKGTHGKLIKGYMKVLEQMHLNKRIVVRKTACKLEMKP